jgi:glycosyltransferase involved in cell wall biosynthesis
MTMDVTIIICTYNRAELGRTLDSMKALEVSPDLQWEIVVVDNNSTDGTRETVRAREGALPVRYLFEERQGKSYALNSGIESTNAPLLVMTDDDVNVTPGWLMSYIKAAKEDPDATFFGGKVLTHWGVKPPHWAVENYDWLKSITRYDQGDKPHYLKDHRDLFVGANLAMRKKLYEAGYTYRTDWGPAGDYGSGSTRKSGEEGELEERLVRDGYKGLYNPGCVVYHRERPLRLTRHYIHWYFRHVGREKRMRDGMENLGPVWFGVPRYLWRVLVKEGLRYLTTRTAKSSRVWLKAECDLMITLGEIEECREFSRTGGKV